MFALSAKVPFKGVSGFRIYLTKGVEIEVSLIQLLLRHRGGICIAQDLVRHGVDVVGLGFGALCPFEGSSVVGHPLFKGALDLHLPSISRCCISVKLSWAM